MHVLPAAIRISDTLKDASLSTVHVALPCRETLKAPGVIKLIVLSTLTAWQKENQMLTSRHIWVHWGDNSDLK